MRQQKGITKGDFLLLCKEKMERKKSQRTWDPKVAIIISTWFGTPLANKFNKNCYQLKVSFTY